MDIQMVRKRFETLENLPWNRNVKKINSTYI